MSRIFISLSANGSKHLTLERNFQKFFYNVLRFKGEGIVFSSSIKSESTASVDFIGSVMNAVNASDFFIFLITEEFMFDWSFGFEIGAACLHAGIKRCYPLLGNNVVPEYLSITPFAGFKPQYYKDRGALEKLGSTLYSAGITSRSPNDFGTDLDTFCTLTRW